MISCLLLQKLSIILDVMAAMRYFLAFSFTFLCFLAETTAQNAKIGTVEAIGLDARWYPAGYIFTASTYFHLHKSGAFFVKLGANLAQREDFGKHDNEEGEAYGGGVGYNHYFNWTTAESPFQFFVGAYVEFWDMQIRWTEDGHHGRTDIQVVQPVLQLGCQYSVKKMYIQPTIAFGREINVRTVGDNVGEGGISLAGVELGYTF